MGKNLDFTHLHVHSSYSFLDGLSHIKNIVEAAKTLGQKSIALTDHGNMIGCVEFYKECKKQGISPVIGMEGYFSYDTDVKSKRSSEVNSHLILLAKNNQGYQNLMKLATLAYTDNFYWKPRVTLDLLDKYKDGIIAGSACLASPFRKAWYSDDETSLKWNDSAEKLIDIFKDNFYFEVQPYDADEQREWNRIVREEGKKRNIPVVVTTDAHYIKKSDFEIHNTLLAIQTRSYLDDPKRMKHDSPTLYLFSVDELVAAGFSEEEITNSQYIADSCNVTLDFSHKFPKVSNSIQRIKDICLPKINSKEYSDRFNYELEVIEKLGFGDYFMVLHDIVGYAKNNGIETGPGRGSAAGSLVCFLLEITEVNPIKHNLIFERFLNENRVGLPDIDIDFEDERRGEVIDYIIRKYGRDKTSNISTIGRLGLKQAIKDVCFVNRIPFKESNELTSLVPFGIDSIKEAMTSDKCKPFMNKIRSIPNNASLIDAIAYMTGMPRQPGTHASAMVISPDEITTHTPLMKIKDDVVTQFDMRGIEDSGLVKFDTLGLRNLTVIRKTLEMIDKKGDDSQYIRNRIASLNDAKVYKMIADGHTKGCFQIETRGISGLCKSIKVSCFEDIAHVISLYRPSVLNTPMLETYLSNRKHPDNIQYVHPALKEFIGDTYGIVLFQEQLMQMARVVAGFSMTEADELRRGIAKKKPEILETFKSDFLDRTKKNGYSQKEAELFFSFIEAAGDYSFNASHAISYAMVSYATAWLKCFYPLEYMLSLLNSTADETQVGEYINEARRLGIGILLPDINLSDYSHKLSDLADNTIQLGFKVVKGIGESASEFILSERDSSNYTSVQEFLTRIIPLTKINTRSVNSLALAGCFDSLESNRSKLITDIDDKTTHIVNVLKKLRKVKSSEFLKRNRGVKFDYPKLCQEFYDELKDEEVTQLSKNKLMAMEQEIFGFYINNPIEEKASEINMISLSSIEELKESKDNKNLIMVGTISNPNTMQMKRKKGEWCKFILNTTQDSVPVSIFADKFYRSKQYINDGQPSIVIGTYNEYQGQVGLIAKIIYPFTQEKLDELSKL